MLQLLLYGLLAVLLAVGLFFLAAQFLPAGEQIAPSLRDEPPWELPADRTLRGEDIDTVRLPVALRGYRFAETDLLLDRLAGELRDRDNEIARLRGRQPQPVPAAALSPAPAPAQAPAPAPAPAPPSDAAYQPPPGLTEPPPSTDHDER